MSNRSSPSFTLPPSTILTSRTTQLTAMKRWPRHGDGGNRDSTCAGWHWSTSKPCFIWDALHLLSFQSVSSLPEPIFLQRFGGVYRPGADFLISRPPHWSVCVWSIMIYASISLFISVLFCNFWLFLLNYIYCFICKTRRLDTLVGKNHEMSLFL